MRTNSNLHSAARLRTSSLLLTLFAVLAFAGTGIGQEDELRITWQTVVESQVGVNRPLTIVVDNLDKWLAKSGNDYSKFVLVMDGNKFNSLHPAQVDVKDDKTGKVYKGLRFDLKHDVDKDAWTAVYSRRRPEEFTNRNVYVTVQQDGVRVIGDAMANLKVIDRDRFTVFVILSLAAIASFWWLGLKSDVLRIPGPQPNGLNRKGKPARKPYSMARAQMAFWFCVVIISYVFIWLATSYLSNLPASVLGLIGISAATGLASAVVDSNKKTDLENLRRTFEEKLNTDQIEASKLQSKIAALNATVNAIPPPADLEQQKSTLIAKQAELAAKQQEINQTNQEIASISAKLDPPSSSGFINDILSDDDGVSFHRLQIVVWTVVLILIFIVSVYDVLAMPDYDKTLLALMGISGGTYIGFKLPAQQG
jgi:chaperonin cofactor prefoldin